MIIPDVNILLHAWNANSQRHSAARAWLEDALSDTVPVGLAWPVLLGFIRISTNARLWPNPLRVNQATAAAGSLLTAPSAEIVSPGARHAEIVFELLESAGTAGNLTSDAHIAALAIEYRAEVATTDTDFARFPGVRFFNPTAR